MLGNLTGSVLFIETPSADPNSEDLAFLAEALCAKEFDALFSEAHGFCKIQAKYTGLDVPMNLELLLTF